MICEVANIKKKYFELAKKYHPDVNKEKGSEERFKAISEAYEILKDDEKRQAYDTFGHAGVNNGAPGQGGMGGSPFGGGGFGFGGFQSQGGFHQGNISQEDLFDIFEQAFGGADPGQCARDERGHLGLGLL